MISPDCNLLLQCLSPHNLRMAMAGRKVQVSAAQYHDGDDSSAKVAPPNSHAVVLAIHSRKCQHVLARC